MSGKLKQTAAIEAVLVLGIGAAFFLWPNDQITVASWKRIRVGMTLEQVERILGRPGMNQEDFANLRLDKAKKSDDFPVIGAKVFIEWDPIMGFENDPANYKVWFGQHGILGIQLDRNGRVKVKNFQEFPQPERRWPPIIDRIRDWLGW